MKLVFLGPPGAGKGTQAKSICHKLGIAHISTGDMLRREVEASTELGKQAKVIMDEGGLVPDDIILGMVANRITQHDCTDGFLFDGFPRNIAQAEALSGVTDIDAVVDIAVDDDALIDRLGSRRVCLKCGGTYRAYDVQGDMKCTACGGDLIHRDDDKPETIAKRLNVYHEKTKPLKDYYEDKEILIEVNGDAPMSEVTQAILTVLGRADD